MTQCGFDICLKATDLYPEGYDLSTLFVSYKEIKLEKDIARVYKKALKKIQKEIKNNKVINAVILKIKYYSICFCLNFYKNFNSYS